MTERTLKVQYYNQYSELVEVMKNIDNNCHRIARELLSSAFLVHQNTMGMSL